MLSRPAREFFPLTDANSRLARGLLLGLTRRLMLAEAHHETFKQVYAERFAGRYGSWRAEIEPSLFAFLDCGVEERGFARVRCDACRRGFRVALSRCAWRTVRDLYRVGLRDRRAVPGMVVSIQTHGDQAANWQPHLHALVTAGVVDGAGAFTPLPPAAAAEELFRRRAIAMLRQRGRLEDEAATGLLAWRARSAGATSTRSPARTVSPSTRWRCWPGCASTSRRRG